MITAKALLANLSISIWSGRKLDKRITDETNRQHGAARDGGRWNKMLIHESHLAEITRIAGEARRDHARLTLAWFDAGARMLPCAIYAEYKATMATHADSFRPAVESLLANWERIVAAAPDRLNGMYNAADYPAADTLRARFRFAVEFMPVPRGDFRADLPQAEADAIAADVEARMVADMRARALEAVKTMAEKLAAYKPAAKAGDKSEGIFRDSLVEHVRELSRLLPAFNVSDNAQFAALADRIAAHLTVHDAETLRESAVIRASVAQQASAIAADMAAFM